MIYLDHAATAPPDPAVVTKLQPFLTGRFGNPSEPHALGRQARADLEEARAGIAAALGARPDDVILTGGGTEADNIAVLGRCHGTPGRIVISALEHPAVARAADSLAAGRWNVVIAPVLADGQLDVLAFGELVRPVDALACVMAASNVTGVVQPLAEVAAICAHNDVPLHIDAVQAAAGMELDVGALPGEVTLAVAAHKLGGPRGIGALVGPGVGTLEPIVHGGGQERGLRSGTENVAGAVALAEALRIRQGDAAPAERERRAALRDALEQRLALPVAGGAAPRLPGHALLLTAYRGDTVVRLLDERGIAVSAGSACASGDPQPDPVLGAMGIDQVLARGAVRVTLGPTTTAEEIDALVAAWAEIEQGLEAAREATS
ncbi:MAG: cysteine desulfurase family protein [Gaiellales bacterium]